MKYTETVRLGLYSNEEYLGLCLKAVENLGWSLYSLDREGFAANISRGYIGEPAEFSITSSDYEAHLFCNLFNSGLLSSHQSKKKIDALMQECGRLKQEFSKSDFAEFWDEAVARITPDQSEQDIKAPGAANIPPGKLSFNKALLPHRGFIVTPILIYLNLLVFLVMILSGVDVFSPDVYDMLDWGASYKPFNQEGEAWRLLSACFLHFGVVHLLFNMYALLFIGQMLEPMLGTVRMTFSYLLTGLFSSAVSMWWHDMSVSAGASGAIFGMYGLFISMLIFKKIDNAVRKPLLFSIGTFVLYNIIFGFKEGIDNAAHIGGCISGFLIGASTMLAEQRIKSAVLRVLSFVASLLILLSGSYLLYSQSSDDLLEYSRAMEEFAKLENKALEVYSIPLDMPRDDRLYRIQYEGIHSWEECLKTLEIVKGLELPENLVLRNVKLEEYCHLRIESYKVLYANEMNYSDANIETLYQLNGKIEQKIKELSRP
jgi:rhomboid protease GluP